MFRSYEIETSPETLRKHVMQKPQLENTGVRTLYLFRWCTSMISRLGELTALPAYLHISSYATLAMLSLINRSNACKCTQCCNKIHEFFCHLNACVSRHVSYCMNNTHRRVLLIHTARNSYNRTSLLAARGHMAWHAYVWICREHIEPRNKNEQEATCM